MSIITIIGSGMMGSAMARPASDNGHQVRLVGSPLDDHIIAALKAGKDHPTLKRSFAGVATPYYITELQEALKDADVILAGISSFGVDWFGDFVLPKIPEEIPVLTVTKGLWNTPEGELLPYPMVWKKKLDSIGKKLSLNAVGGTCTSYELVAHYQTEVAFCGDDLTVLEKLRSIMKTDYYHISITTDVVGIESAVALKNGYALAIALTIGLN